MALAGCGPQPGASPGNEARAVPGSAARTVQGSGQGADLYARHCASCHGANLEGQPNWRERKADGRLPAPPHDASGHTWHHADEVLFNLTKNGLGPYAPPGYASDMPAFAGTLSDDEIRAVLAYIKSRWPASIREKQAQIGKARAASPQR